MARNGDNPSRPFQRHGAESNTQVGRDFESIAREFFNQHDLLLHKGFSVPIGVGVEKKEHLFDLGSSDPPILVECKSHRWISGDNVPSAKMAVWNEAMFYFHLVPADMYKVLFVLRDFSPRRGESLAQYYVRTHRHLIPPTVGILEYDEDDGSVRAIGAVRHPLLADAFRQQPE